MKAFNLEINQQLSITIQDEDHLSVFRDSHRVLFWLTFDYTISVHVTGIWACDRYKLRILFISTKPKKQPTIKMFVDMFVHLAVSHKLQPKLQQN